MLALRTVKKGTYLLVFHPVAFWHKVVQLARYRLYYYVIHRRPALRRLFPHLHGKKAKRMNGVLFEFDLDLSPHICFHYLGLDDDSVPLRQLLRDGDTFIDVGANIGFISALAVAQVGKTGQVHAFEPVPLYFDMLTAFAKNNTDYRVFLNQMALGDHSGRVEIHVTKGLGMSTLVKGLRDEEEIVETVQVPIRRLDGYIEEHGLEKIALIKIDVEGYELSVLRGLSGYLKTEAGVQTALFVELMPFAYGVMGSSFEELTSFLEEMDFVAVNTDLQRVRRLNRNAVANVLFIHRSRWDANRREILRAVR